VFAVEDPEDPVVCRMVAGNVDGWLFGIFIPMRPPGGNKIPIRFNIHAADISQMRFNQKNPNKHERYGRNKRKID
jgi:hypothetical protein